MEALRSAGHLRKSHGIVFRIDVGGMLRHVPWMSSEPEAEAGGGTCRPAFLPLILKSGATS